MIDGGVIFRAYPARKSTLSTTMIKPALTQAEWATGEAQRAEIGGWFPIKLGATGQGMHIAVSTEAALVATTSSTLSAVIAVANAALPNDDPRKITRASVDELQEVADRLDELADQSDEEAFAVWTTAFKAVQATVDVLNSYLPPSDA